MLIYAGQHCHSISSIVSYSGMSLKWLILVIVCSKKKELDFLWNKARCYVLCMKGRQTSMLGLIEEVHYYPEAHSHFFGQSQTSWDFDKASMLRTSNKYDMLHLNSQTVKCIKLSHQAGSDQLLSCFFSWSLISQLKHSSNALHQKFQRIVRSSIETKEIKMKMGA